MSRDGLAGLDAWLTTTPEDSAHHPECNCEKCHEEHDVRELAGDIDFDCCTDALADMKDAGEVCLVKTKEHFNIYLDGAVVNGRFVLAKPSKCLECEHEKICDKPEHSACA